MMKRSLAAAPRSAMAAEDPAEEGLVVLSLDMKPIALDAGAEAILRDLDRAEERANDHHRLPKEIASLLAVGTDGESTPDEGLWFTANDHQYKCRSFAVRPTNGGVPMLALHIRREVSVSDVIRGVAAEYRLTDREQEVLVGIAMGLTSKELGERLRISPNTVKSFLRLIMIKLGVPTRAAIVGKLIAQGRRARGAPGLIAEAE